MYFTGFSTHLKRIKTAEDKGCTPLKLCYNSDCNLSLYRILMPFILLISFLFTFSFAPLSYAQGVDIIPATEATATGVDLSEATTHPPLRLTMDQSEIIRLDENAGSVIIGNPLHVSVLADSARTLVAVPQAAGASHITVLGKDGNVIMRRNVIVGSPKEKYIRIRQSCFGEFNEEAGCVPTQTYYCPAMCHQILNPEEATQSDNVGTATSNNANDENDAAGSAGDTEDGGS